MWNESLIIILIFELLLIGYLVYLCLKKERKVLQTITYFGLIFIINFLLNLIALIHEVNDMSMFDVLICGLNGLKTFIFDADILDYNISFAAEFPLYFVVYGLGVFMGAAMTLFTAIDTFKYFFINKIRLHHMLHNDCDILIGNLDICKKYAKNSKNSVLWLDSISDKDEINSLIEDGYVVVNKEFSALNMNTLFDKKNKYSVVCFNENSKKTIEVINVIEQYTSNYSFNNAHFYLEVLDSESVLLKDLLSENLSKYVTTFSKEELLIRKFVEENPLTKYLPEDFINSDTTLNNDKHINVLMVGFDNVSRQLLRQLILNNQFASIKDNEYVNHLVNYHLFDLKEEFECDLIKGLDRRFDEFKKHEKDYFVLPEKVANIICNDININSYDLIDQIKEIVDVPNSYNYIFVSNSKMNSYEFMSKASEEITNNNVHFFLNIDEVVREKESITFYGLNDDILNHSVIVDEKLNELAIVVNAKYSNLCKEDYYGKWNLLSDFSKKSNIYAALNLRFKLNLFGLDYVLGTSETDLIKEVTSDITMNNEFSFYKNKNLTTSLIAQEHLRWNAFHLLNGYRPMKKKDIIINKDIKVVKDTVKKEHACITTYDGLSLLANYELKETLKFNSSAKLEDFDVYKYDLLLISVANEVLNELGYKVIKK